jgi:hypothetical protein
MPSPYTPDPTTTQSPSAPPSPGVFPTVQLPIDSDPPNAATWAQAYKVLGDFVAYLMDPFSIISAWATKLARWRDALLRVRFALDHWGMPTGKWDRWLEGWQGDNLAQAGSTNVTAGPFNRWRFVGNATDSATTTYMPGVVAGNNYSDNARSIKIQLDGSASAQRTEMRLDDLWVSGLCLADTIVVLRADATLVSVLAVNWVPCGFTSEAENVNNIQHGIFFIRPDSPGTNYKCRTINGGSPTEVDSGVLGSAGVKHDFEIHYVGANVCDDSTARALFFIDGNLVANITGTIPDTQLLIPIFGGTTTGGPNTNQAMVLGPVEYSQITAIETP